MVPCGPECCTNYKTCEHWLYENPQQPDLTLEERVRKLEEWVEALESVVRRG